MTRENWTRHAEHKCQKRGILPADIDMLLACGAAAYSKGRKILHLQDKRAWKKARQFMADNDMLPDNHLRKLYAVVADDGTVITASWRDKRIMRDWNAHKSRKHRRRRVANIR